MLATDRVEKAQDMKVKEPQEKSSDVKSCPFSDTGFCQGSNCALWIKLVKIEAFATDYYTFEGCGLVQHIPWKQHEIVRAKDIGDP